MQNLKGTGTDDTCPHAANTGMNTKATRKIHTGNVLTRIIHKY